jgi:NAD(P)-dependent dehydrogenase (short-subunit alcohol dehydrogenase family)
MKLLGKVALVTGGSQGIGRGVALRLARDSADIVVAYRSHPEEAKETSAEIETHRRRVVAFKADLSNRTEIDRLVSAAFGHFGSIDILVNNAGVEKKAPFWAVTEEGGDSRFERPAGRVMAVGNPAVRTPPLPALWPIWRVLIGGPLFKQIRFASPNHLRSIRVHQCPGEIGK